MSFNDNAKNHYASLLETQAKLFREKENLYHDCDCDFCESRGLADDEERLEEIEKECREIQKTIDSLERWAKDHNIELVKAAAVHAG